VKAGAKVKSGQHVSPAARARAVRVGAAEFRGNLAKYLNQAESGRAVIEGRNRSACVLLKLEEDVSASVFGCMRDRTEYSAGTVFRSAEEWSPGAIPCARVER
jgi:hypothetical protein